MPKTTKTWFSLGVIMELLVGYNLKNVLYKGSRSRVYRATRGSDGAPVIIKVHSASFPDALLLNRFKREFEIGSLFSNPHIIAYLAVQKFGHGLALIEEDAGARAISELIPKGGMALPLFLHIAIQLASGLEAIHAKDVMHKDIKPANLVYNEETGQAKIIDFGLASLLAEERLNPLHANHLEGTPSYMSPEQTGRMNRMVDYRTDFYSLGVTFYEMLCGQSPFVVKDKLELVHSHIAGEAPSLRERGRDIPEVLAALVKRLMSKCAEDRYQSAFGLRADLQTCRKRLNEKGLIRRFSLGREDYSEKFRIPQSLYGREAEIKLLLDTFHRVATGEKEMMLIAGYSGIGKSSLVREIHKPIVARQGLFISGKFDQFQRSTPYAAMIQALRELLDYLMAEPETDLARWRERLLAAIHPNGRLLVELIPDLESLIGEQPALETLVPGLAEKRFNAVFRNFVKVFTQKENPLVLFLDDLQWADSATLELLRVLGQDTDSYLMVIGAYRDNEVDHLHPLMLALDDLVKMGVKLHEVTLKPLRKTDLTRLIADTLRTRPGKVRDLASLVMEKTAGNPFFVNRFLESLYARGLLRFERTTCQWTWDLSRIDAQNMTENVVDLVLEKLRTFPEETQNLLGMASCLGNRFLLSTLVMATGQGSVEVVRGLIPAIREGLAAPVGTAFDWINTKVFEENPPNDMVFRFLHDRVQQAAYALFEEADAKRAHLTIGRRLLTHLGEQEPENLLFLTVEQLNKGKVLIGEPEDRLMLTRLNHRAGTHAVASLAWEPALHYFKEALGLASDRFWSEHYDLTFDLHLECAKCLTLLNQTDQAYELFDLILDKAQTVFEQALVSQTRQTLCSMHYFWDEALFWGRKALHLLGYSIPEENAVQELQADAEAEIQTFETALAEIRIEDLLDRQMDDDYLSLAMQVLAPMASNAYLNGKVALHQLLLFRGMNLMIAHGFLAESVAICSWIPLYYSANHRYPESLRFARISMGLVERYPNPSNVANTFCNVGASISFGEHVSRVIEVHEEGYRIGRDNGDSQAALHNMGNALFWDHFAGKPLETVLARADEMIKISRGKEYLLPLGFAQAYRRLALFQMGLEDNPNLDQEDYHVEIWNLLRNGNLWPVLLGLRFQCAFWCGSETEALALGEAAREQMHLIPGLLFWVDVDVYYALLLARRYNRCCPAEQGHYLARIEKISGRLQSLAESCPANYEHKYLLIQAEYSRLRRRATEATSNLYDKAASSAASGHFLQYEALANELHGRFWLTRNREKYASLHIREACYLFQRWNADVRVRRLEQDYPALNLDMAHFSTHSQSETEILTQTMSSLNSDSEGLDFYSLMRASQAISSEIQLDRLLSVLIQTIVQNAGASKGILMLESNGQFLVEAVAELKNERVEVLQSLTLRDSGLVPESIVRYVVRTQQALILHDETQQIRFSRDPYFETCNPKSIICTPVINKDAVRGALYLENNLVRRAFTSNRISVLDILLAQATVSLENSRLYDSLTEGMEERKRANQEINKLNEELEERVLERTSQLKKAQKELLEKAHLAGMADIATSVLHNVGNVINSIIISTQIINQQARGSKLGSLARANKALDNVLTPEIRAANPRAEQLLNYYQLVGKMLKDESDDMLENIGRIEERINVINDVITAQQDFISGSFAAEPMPLEHVVNDALNIFEASFERNEVTPTVQFNAYPRVYLQKIKLIHVLINIFKNAVEAMDHLQPRQRTIQIVIGEERSMGFVRIADNGEGIESHNMNKIFNHGFTTKLRGHGFGLHSCANAMTEMGGKLYAESDGKDKGATFLLRFDLVAPKKKTPNNHEPHRPNALIAPHAPVVDSSPRSGMRLIQAR